MLDMYTCGDSSAIEQSIPSRFEQEVAIQADKLAMRGIRDFTYAELNHFVNGVAREILEALPRDAGFDPVAVLVPGGAEAIAALLAVLKAGKIHVSLDAGGPRERVAAQFADSQARVVVTSPAHRALAESLPGARIVMLVFPPSISRCENPGLSIPADAPATIQYTSGSTGSPKGVLHPHRSILHNVSCHASSKIDSHADAGGIGAGDRLLPNRLLSGLNGLLNGASVFPYAVKEHGMASLSDWLRENEITVMSLVPTTFRRFASQLTDEDRFPHLRLIKLTGEAIYRRDVDLFQRRFPRGCFLQFSFALTETNAVAWRVIGHDEKTDRDLVPVGRPVAGKEVLLLDDEVRPVPAGATGEIAVRSRFLASGYWRQPELTESRFLRDAEDPAVRTYLTGDLGRIGPDGLLIHLGRKDSQVKIRANRVELAEVEAALRSVDGVRDGAVVARPDESGETCLAAYYEASVAPPPPFGGVRRALASKLPDYMVPATVMLLEHLPLLPNGKIDRRALPSPSAAAAARAAGTAPRTPMERLVAESWRTVLRVKSVDTADNFFDLGGNSLAAVESATALERQTGVRISPVAIASQTLAQVAAMYQERAAVSAGGLMPALRRLVTRRGES
jgi:amino acid adenylation domain-containing protein